MISPFLPRVSGHRTWELALHARRDAERHAACRSFDRPQVTRISFAVEIDVTLESELAGETCQPVDYLLIVLDLPLAVDHRLVQLLKFLLLGFIGVWWRRLVFGRCRRTLLQWRIPAAASR